MSGRTPNAGIKALIQVVEEIRNHYPRMELGQLAVLLRVLDKPGISPVELGKLTGLSKSAASRAVRTLGSQPFTHDGDGSARMGLNLVSQVPDPHDARSNLVAPTRLGRRLGEEFEKIIGEKYGTPAGEPVAGGRADPGGETS